jgi:hypothetical protein
VQGVCVSQLRLVCLNEGVYQVVDGQGVCLGHVKWLRGAWRLKALWMDEQGDWVPGGGPLNPWHNVVVTEPNAQAFVRALRQHARP